MKHLILLLLFVLMTGCATSKPSVRGDNAQVESTNAAVATKLAAEIHTKLQAQMNNFLSNDFAANLSAKLTAQMTNQLTSSIEGKIESSIHTAFTKNNESHEQAASSTSGAGSHSMAMTGSGAPLLVANVVLVVAIAWVAGMWLKTKREGQRYRWSMGKLMNAVEDNDSTKEVKEQFHHAVSNTRSEKLVKDILKKEVAQQKSGDPNKLPN